MKVSKGAWAAGFALAATVLVFVITEVLVTVVMPCSEGVPGTGTTSTEETAVVSGLPASGVMLFSQLVVPSLTTKE